MNAFDEPDPEDAKTDDDGSGQSQRIVTILKHLFRMMAGELELDTEQMFGVRIRDFVLWCNDNKEKWATDAKYELAAGLKVRINDVDMLAEQFEDPYAATALCMPTWHMLCLSGRKPIEHTPDFIHIALTMGFDAGTDEERACQIQIPTKFKPGTPLTDGFLCALMLDQMRSIVQTVAGLGMDHMYKEKSQVVSSDRSKIIRETMLPEDRQKKVSDGL